MEARIRNDSLPQDMERFAQWHEKIKAMQPQGTKSGWRDEAKKFLIELTTALRTVRDRLPQARISTELVYLQDAQRKLLHYSSHWQMELKK